MTTNTPRLTDMICYTIADRLFQQQSRKEPNGDMCYLFGVLYKYLNQMSYDEHARHMMVQISSPTVRLRNILSRMLLEYKVINMGRNDVCNVDLWIWFDYILEWINNIQSLSEVGTTEFIKGLFENSHVCMLESKVQNLVPVLLNYGYDIAISQLKHVDMVRITVIKQYYTVETRIIQIQRIM